jgi:putative ABC transport system permease protein
MDRLAGTLEGQFPATNTGWTINVVPMYLQEVGRDRRALLVLSAVVAFVLLIACANLANLLSARAAGRRREMAVRAALGASFAHLVRLLFTESLMLSLLGGVAGVLLASVATPWLLALNPDGLTRAPSAIVDGRVLLFTAAISVVAAFMFGLVPALELRRLDIERPLREAGRSGARSMTRSRSRRWLVVSEVAISFAVLALAGLSMKSFLRVLAVDPGVRAGNLLTMAVRPPGSAYSVDRIRTFYSDLLDRLERLPGVTSAAATSMLPLGGDNRVYGFRAESSPTIRNEANYRVVTPHYFRTMGMAVVAGRDFDDRDATDFAQVAIVNQAMARRFWSAAPGALGQRIVIRGPAPPTTIVGVVSDVRHFGVELPAEPEMYVPHRQAPMSGMTVVIRTVGDPNALAREAREQVRAIDPNLPVSNMRTMENVMEVSTAPRRFTMLLFDLFGAIALLLAAVGVYGVTRHAVAERTAEIGVRVALGAAPRQILMLIVGQHLRLFLTGTVIGAFGALLVGRLTSAMLFQVQPNDPVVFLAGACVLVTVSLAASYLPARRALRINPVVTLRSE